MANHTKRASDIDEATYQLGVHLRGLVERLRLKPIDVVVVLSRLLKSWAEKNLED